MDLELWAEIRRLFLREGRKKRWIARHLGVDPKTVRRALAQSEYASRKAPAPRESKLDPFKDTVRALLEQHPDLSQVRILEELRVRGYTGGRSILGDFVRTLRPAPAPEVFLALAFAPGEAAQVDWAHCGTIEVDGVRRRLSAFLYLLCWSRWLYVEFTVSERLEVFLDCHVHAMEASRGVPIRGIYDNLRSVVLAHVGREIRFNPRFLDFARHYDLEPVACAPYRPNEKGRVENAVKYLKHSFLAGRELIDLDTLNREVRRWLDEVANVRQHRSTRRRPIDLLEEERNHLGPLPARPYDTRAVVSVRVNPVCRVRFEQNTYTVPPAYVGTLLTLKASADTVSLYAGTEEVAVHARARGKGQDLVDPWHLKAVLTHKRRGERGVLVQRFLALGGAAEAYLKGLVQAEVHLYRHLRRLLRLADVYGRQEILDALDAARAHEAYGADYVERIVLQERRRRSAPPARPLTSLERAPDLANVHLPEIDLEQYDALLGTGGLDEPEEAEGAAGGEPPDAGVDWDPGELRGDPEGGEPEEPRSPGGPGPAHG